MIVINLMYLYSSAVVKKLQELLDTKDSPQSEVMDLLGDPTLIKHLMALTDQQVY